MNHRPPPVVPGVSSTSVLHRLSHSFFSADGFGVLSAAIIDECKLLQDVKRLLERRMVLDEQYAKNLQELTASADRLVYPPSSPALASVSETSAVGSRKTLVFLLIATERLAEKLYCIGRRWQRHTRTPSTSSEKTRSNCRSFN